MKTEIEYWNPRNTSIVTKSGFRYLDNSPQITKIEIWVDTKENIFKKFDKENNKLRYCNGSYLKFKDISLQKEYIQWHQNLDESTKFKMYYGNGVVD